MKNYHIFKSSRSPFVKFTQNHLCRSFFLTKWSNPTCKFISNRLQHRCFPVIFAQFIKELRNCILCIVHVWPFFRYDLGKSVFSTYLLENWSHTQTHTCFKVHEIRNVLKSFIVLVLKTWLINLLKIHCNTISNGL